ncbi:hypothetical protein [Rhodothermus profundi]|uniref:Uncharacterized protein n=1 Tax=Rhodothermus profundi TaxID=633813 RepID=A0A1M6XS27_9BACT|nr:hypothetical protein [Rhodothermus profundi]SHL08807.1 hypothetical protein SAMN04488087_2692 [Rhodothermus profundi]
MHPEDYQRLKEAEKEHLRALRQLKQAVRMLRRRRAIDEALARLERQTEKTLTAHDEALARLALETAYQEARLELALAGRVPPSAEEVDPVQTRRRAQELLRQLREETETSAAPDSSPQSKERPEKTLGRLRPPGS